MFGKKKKKNTSDDDISPDILHLSDAISNNGDSSFYPDKFPDVSDDEMVITDSDIEKMKKGETNSNSDENKKSSLGKKYFIVGVISVLAIAAVTFFSSNSSSNNSNESQPQTTQTEQNVDENNNPNKKNSGIVVKEKIGESYVGSEDGNPINATGAILAFDYAYYNTRDGKEAIKYFNPDAKNYDAAFIQENIDRVPKGTKYQLSITPEEIGHRYSVVLTIALPGEEPQSFDQNFEMMKQNGQYYIKSFTSKISE